MADNENNNGDGINREYKDRLFKFIFGNPNHKEWALDVFNTLGNTNYTGAVAAARDAAGGGIRLMARDDA